MTLTRVERGYMYAKPCCLVALAQSLKLRLLHAEGSYYRKQLIPEIVADDEDCRKSGFACSDGRDGGS